MVVLAFVVVAVAAQEEAEEESTVLAWGSVEGMCAVFVLIIVYRGVREQLGRLRGGAAKPKEQ